MRLLKPTAFSLLLFSFLITISSCEKDAERDKVYVYSKSDILMTGAQSVPMSTTTATGTISVTYDKRTRLLNYTITWSGLSGAPTGIGIYGPAPVGYAALTPTGTLAPGLVTIATTGLQINGTFTGSMLIDGVKFKEQDLLNQLYYVRINTAASPAGAIRGQIKFQ